MLKAFYLIELCSVRYFSVSVFTKPVDSAVLENMTLKKPLAFITDGIINGFTDSQVLAGLLPFVMILLYVAFS